MVSLSLQTRGFPGDVSRAADLCTAACCLHGHPSAGSGIAVHWNPGLVNQGHGFDLGTDPVGPLILILSVLSAPVATRKLPRPCGCGKATSGTASRYLEGGCPW